MVIMMPLRAQKIRTRTCTSFSWSTVYSACKKPKLSLIYKTNDASTKTGLAQRPEESALVSTDHWKSMYAS